MKTIKLISTALFLLNSFLSISQPGTLDSSFSKDGKVITHISKKIDNYAYAVAIQPDGKIIAAGLPAFGFTLVRYTTKGFLDNTFGTNGIVVTAKYVSIENTAICLQPDGKILFAGTVSSLSGNFALLRYKKNGILDSSFGNNGIVTQDFFGQRDVASAVMLQSYGKIIIAGTAYDSDGVHSSVALIRYKHDGSHDFTFGMNGKVTTHAGADSLDHGTSAVLLPDGKIVVGGYTQTGSTKHFLLIRYNSNGTVDSTFRTNGRVVSSFNGAATSIGLQPDGKIVLAGYTISGNEHHFITARYTKDGFLDTTFSTNGIVITKFSDTYDYSDIYSVALQSNRKIVVAGSCRTGNSYAFALARYSENGSLDSSFGLNGKVTTNFRSDCGCFDQANAVAIQNDGKIVAAGISGGYHFGFALARYFGDATVIIGNLIAKKTANSSSSLSVYPNPVKDILNITGLTSSANKISILDASGKIIQQTTATDQSFSWNVQFLPPGIYYLQIQNKENQKLKFLKE